MQARAGKSLNASCPIGEKNPAAGRKRTGQPIYSQCAVAYRACRVATLNSYSRREGRTLRASCREVPLFRHAQASTLLTPETILPLFRG